MKRYCWLALSGHAGLSTLSTTFHFYLSAADAKVMFEWSMAERVCEEILPALPFITWSSGTSILRMTCVHHFVMRTSLHVLPFYEVRFSTCFKVRGLENNFFESITSHQGIIPFWNIVQIIFRRTDDEQNANASQISVFFFLQECIATANTMLWYYCVICSCLSRIIFSSCAAPCCDTLHLLSVCVCVCVCSSSSPALLFLLHNLIESYSLEVHYSCYWRTLRSLPLHQLHCFII